MISENPTIKRLEKQIDWYDKKQPQSAIFHWLKIIEIVVAAFISFQRNWISYRSTCENLKHEKYL